MNSNRRSCFPPAQFPETLKSASDVEDLVLLFFIQGFFFPYYTPWSELSAFLYSPHTLPSVKTWMLTFTFMLQDRDRAFHPKELPTCALLNTTMNMWGGGGGWTDGSCTAVITKMINTVKLGTAKMFPLRCFNPDSMNWNSFISFSSRNIHWTSESSLSLLSFVRKALKCKEHFIKT